MVDFPRYFAYHDSVHPFDRCKSSDTALQKVATHKLLCWFGYPHIHLLKDVEAVTKYSIKILDTG